MCVYPAYGKLIIGDLLTSINGCRCDRLSLDEFRAIVQESIEITLGVKRKISEQIKIPSQKTKISSLSTKEHDKEPSLSGRTAHVREKNFKVKENKVTSNKTIRQTEDHESQRTTSSSVDTVRRKGILRFFQIPMVKFSQKNLKIPF